MKKSTVPRTLKTMENARYTPETSLLMPLSLIGFGAWITIDAAFIEKNGTKPSLDVWERYTWGDAEACTWGMIVNNLTVRRNCCDLCIERLAEHTVIALLGPGGDGKTTILKQICYQLYLQGEKVLYNPGAEDFSQIPWVIDPGIILAIDDALSDQSLDVFLQKARENGNRVIFACRTDEWQKYLAEHIVAEKDYAAIFTEKPDLAEAGRFADYLSTYKDVPLTRRKIAGIFHKQKDGFLYASVLVALLGKPLKEGLKQIISRYDKKQLKILACICFIESLGEQTPLKIFSPLPVEAGLEQLDLRKNSMSEIIRVRSTCVVTHHPLIARLLAPKIYTTKGAPFRLRDIFQEVFDRCMCVILEKSYSYSEAGLVSCYKIVKELIAFSFRHKIRSTNVRDRALAELSSSGEILLYCAKSIESVVKRRKYFQESCIRNRKYGALWTEWAKFEIGQGNVGLDVGEINTARWIYKKASEECPGSGAVWAEWARLEIGQRNSGLDVGEENTARWILKRASEECPGSSAVWIEWAKFEIGQGNVGLNVGEENTARWIYKKASEKCSDSGAVWTGWAKLEIAQGNVGADVGEENTARWILKKASKACPDFGAVWTTWAKLEQQNNNWGIGTYKENSVRWIYKIASEKCLDCAEIWIQWANFELQNQNIGSITKKNTACWILKTASNRYPNNGDIWLAWAKFEMNRGNFGRGFQEENTARWILKNFSARSPGSSDIWLAWAKLEAKLGNMGADAGEENTARWILKTASEKYPRDDKIWIAWAKIEIQQENVGVGEDREDTACWILRQAGEKCVKNKTFYEQWERDLGL